MTYPVKASLLMETMVLLHCSSLIGNRLTGPIPKQLGNITTLRNLTLEANQLSGPLPPELGNLVKIERIKALALVRFNTSFFFIILIHPDSAVLVFCKYSLISSNAFSGELPITLAKLTNLKDFRISDNHFSGKLPDFIQNWTQLEKIAIQGSGLEGPIPFGISSLEKLTDLRISDINGTASDFPPLSNMKRMKTLILRNCNLTGPIPAYVGTMAKLKTFKLLEALLSSMHINCGGKEVTISGVNGSTTFSKDQDSGGASKFDLSTENWGFSSTGNFLDNDQDSDNYIASNKSRLTMPDFDLYSSARLSPLFLTYYGLCLRNGNYTVKLHFAEIMFTDDKTYSSLGKRIFDVYIQGKLVLKDFNIENEAGGTHRAVVKNFTAIVTTNTLEICFYWAGKGTQSIPVRGTYGPLISAISVDSDFTPPSESGKKISAAIVIGIVASVLCVIFMILGILWWKGYLSRKSTMDQDPRRLDLQTGSFTLRQIQAATNNFDVANKIGEGGFGPVYKGQLSDGTIIAVKQLSSKSKQGNREFVNELGMITALQHPNLVKLYGCCIEGNQLLLVYEYMENNSLARSLFGLEEQQLKLDWPTRQRICVGVARGLAYLHEESRLKIVHRDIKTTNVLLDKDLSPKISDFGLAKLDEEENTHISTRIAGTFGYMAPEYAMWGYLTDKADVYSFGIVALEIVCGKRNSNYRPKEDCANLLDWAYSLQVRGSLIELVDPKLGSEFDKEEAMGMLTVALLCTNASPTLRPSMSAVVSMLEGRTVIQNLTSESNLTSDNWRFKAMRNHHQQIHSQEQSQSQSQSISMDGPWTGSSSSAADLYPIIMDSEYMTGRE
ncbi:Protein kinase domain-containing protein [Cinnamomum micranthum f. kanehirae]|uniref:non-specific serine/threonine protein kinase n=1 Tax=Cinnamomum micranthum f. kanehirae TaxID=337451 RepID=A0A3S3NJC2_9MAGN|nr:Protein kinase domain-containing protein [Cinnamomum micranthum f. kanehirae]